MTMEKFIEEHRGDLRKAYRMVNPESEPSDGELESLVRYNRWMWDLAKACGVKGSRVINGSKRYPL